MGWMFRLTFTFFLSVRIELNPVILAYTNKYINMYFLLLKALLKDIFNRSTHIYVIQSTDIYLTNTKHNYRQCSTATGLVQT